MIYLEKKIFLKYIYLKSDKLISEIQFLFIVPDVFLKFDLQKQRTIVFWCWSALISTYQIKLSEEWQQFEECTQEDVEIGLW